MNKLDIKQVNALAKRFADDLKAVIGDEKFAKMRALNANTEKYGKGICASHDFCDANMVMGPAFEHIVGREMEADSAADAALWGAAWDEAKEQYLTANPHEDAIEFFRAHDFTYEYPGFFASPLTDNTFLSCAWNWSGTGMWELQHQSNDGHAPEDEFDDALDFDTPDEVVMLRDFLRLANGGK